METSTEKQLPVSNRSCNLLSNAVKTVNKFEQTCQPEKLKLVLTNDTSYLTEFQSEIAKFRSKIFFFL